MWLWSFWTDNLVKYKRKYCDIFWTKFTNKSSCTEKKQVRIDVDTPFCYFMDLISFAIIDWLGPATYNVNRWLLVEGTCGPSTRWSIRVIWSVLSVSWFVLDGMSVFSPKFSRWSQHPVWAEHHCFRYKKLIDFHLPTKYATCPHPK